MVKVSKEFWVSDEFIKIMDESTRLVPESVTDWVFNCPIQKINTGDARSKHKITITYEIDREITIKESELKGVLNKHLSSGLTVDTIMNEFFGGGENE